MTKWPSRPPVKVTRRAPAAWAPDRGARPPPGTCRPLPGHRFGSRGHRKKGRRRSGCSIFRKSQNCNLPPSSGRAPRLSPSAASHWPRADHVTARDPIMHTDGLAPSSVYETWERRGEFASAQEICLPFIWRRVSASADRDKCTTSYCGFLFCGSGVPWLSIALFFDPSCIKTPVFIVRQEQLLLLLAFFRRAWQTGAVFPGDRLSERVPSRMVKLQIREANHSPCSLRTTVARVLPATRKYILLFFFFHLL